jgi:hypothetical protein
MGRVTPLPYKSTIDRFSFASTRNMALGRPSLVAAYPGGAPGMILPSRELGGYAIACVRSRSAATCGDAFAPVARRRSVNQNQVQNRRTDPKDAKTRPRGPGSDVPFLAFLSREGGFAHLAAQAAVLASPSGSDRSLLDSPQGLSRRRSRPRGFGTPPDLAGSHLAVSCGKLYGEGGFEPPVPLARRRACIELTAGG